MREKLEAAARELALEVGKANLTREKVCEKAGAPEGSFGYHTGMKFNDWLETLNLPETGHPREGARLTPDERKEQILGAAIYLSESRGYVHIHFGDIAFHLDITPQLVKHYYPSLDDLYKAIMAKAIETGNSEILAQGIINRHPLALALDEKTQKAAIHAVINK